MASKSMATASLLIFFNLIFFTLVSANSSPCPPPPSSPKHHHHHHHHKTPTPATPTPATPTPATPSGSGSCPIDTLKLGVCANLLGDLVHLVIGTPPKTPCCPLLDGLVDLEAAVCLCTAIKANLLGINLDVPVSLSLLLNYCGKSVPSGFQCA